MQPSSYLSTSNDNSRSKLVKELFLQIAKGFKNTHLKTKEENIKIFQKRHTLPDRKLRRPNGSYEDENTFFATLREMSQEWLSRSWSYNSFDLQLQNLLNPLCFLPPSTGNNNTQQFPLASHTFDMFLQGHYRPRKKEFH